MNLTNLRRPVPGFPGFSVTRDGRIHSQPRQGTRGGWMDIRQADRNGHIGVQAYTNGKRRLLFAHRAVALAWIIPNPSNLPLVLHGDHDPTNNHVSNLRWGTHADNMADMVSAGRQSRIPTRVGSQHSNAKLTERDIPIIRALIREGRLTRKQIGQQFGVAATAIGNIKLGRRWAHVPDEDAP